MQEEIKKLVEEIRDEQCVPYFITNESIELKVKEAIYDTNEKVGYKINYDEDLTARSYIKNYYMYSASFRLAEFRKIYAGDLIDLQIKYNKDTNL